MAQLPAAVIGDAYTSSTAWTVLEDLVEIGNRMGGQEGERRAAAVVERAFEAVGLCDVSVGEFDVPGWWRGSSSLEIGPPGDRTVERDHEVIALPASPPGDVEAELIDVGYGLPGDFGPAVAGRIVMARTDTPGGHDRWIHRMEKYSLAAEAGAVGFVFRNHVPGCLPPTGTVVDSRYRPGPIPAVGVSAEIGAALERHAAREPVTVRLAVDCREAPAVSRNVEAVVGPDTDREVLVTAHVDAHDIAEGAQDNGVGCSLVVELGRLLRTIEDDLDTRVRLVTFGSEELGLVGAYHWAGTYDLDAVVDDLDGVKCVINVDGAGESGVLELRSYGFDVMEAAFDAVVDDLGLRMDHDTELSPHSDAWPFVEQGVPAVTAGSVSGQAGRGWGHTHADTLDKVEPGDLRSLAIPLLGAVVECASDDRRLPHKSAVEIRETLDEGYVTELETIGRWRYD